MADKIITATANKHTVSIVFCNMKETCDEALKIHGVKGATAEALCRALIGGALLSSTLKNDDDLITMIIRGEGPAGGITVRADKHGKIKGYIYNPEAEGENVASVLGPGMLTVIKDIGMREPYTGQLPLVTGEIAEDITAYFAESEQTPSSCGIGIRFNEDGTIKAAGGFLIQLLPDAPYTVIDQLELDLMRHPSPPELILDYGDDFPKLLNAMLPGLDIQILDEETIEWECTCSREKMEQVLISIGRNDLESIVSEGDDVEVVCDYCKNKYTFTPEEINDLYKKAL